MKPLLDDIFERGEVTEGIAADMMISAPTGPVSTDDNPILEDIFLSWEPHQGERGGRGWRSTVTGEVRYQKDRPSEREEGQEKQTAHAASGEQRDESGKRTAGEVSGDTGKGSQKSGANKLSYERGYEIRDAAHGSLRFELSSLKHGHSTPAQVVKAARQHFERYAAAETHNFHKRYLLLKARAVEKYGTASVESPEWAAVKTAFTKSRDEAVSALDGMAQIVEGAAQRGNVLRADLADLADESDRHLQAHQDAVRRIGDALDRFKGKSKPVVPTGDNPILKQAFLSLDDDDFYGSLPQESEEWKVRNPKTGRLKR